MTSQDEDELWGMVTRRPSIKVGVRFEVPCHVKRGHQPGQGHAFVREAPEWGCTDFIDMQTAELAAKKDGHVHIHVCMSLIE